MVALVLGVLAFVAVRILPSSGPPVASEPLVSLLNVRADNVLRLMERAEERWLDKIRNGKAAVPPPIAAKILDRMKASRQLFKTLQAEHVATLQRGELVAAHELLAEVHALLEHYAGWDPPSRDRPEYLQWILVNWSAEWYPGSLPSSASLALLKLDSLAWPPKRSVDPMRINIESLAAEADTGVQSRVSRKLDSCCAIDHPAELGTSANGATR